MNVEQKSLIDSQIEDFISKMDDYITSLGLGNVIYSSEVEKALSFSADELRGLNGEECGIYCAKLQQFAFFLQTQQNRYRNLTRWTNQAIIKVIAKEGQNYGDSYTKHEIVRASVVLNNSHAAKLEEMYDEFFYKNEELEQLANRVSAMSKTLADLQYTKRFNRG